MGVRNLWFRLYGSMESSTGTIWSFDSTESIYFTNSSQRTQHHINCIIIIIVVAATTAAVAYFVMLHHR